MGGVVVSVVTLPWKVTWIPQWMSENNGLKSAISNSLIEENKVGDNNRLLLLFNYYYYNIFV